ncbi:MAG TPA: peptidoglycan DD-metalloendopeptidase family protein [Gammaproteobacteria bacterium]|nr:peptidoglycan DD-metalloendopeptidase family protein [Gammaproteobacteria bacterium]
MGKIWAPADKVLSEIGRFVLIRPIVSAILLLTAIIITLLSNGAFNLSTSTPRLKQVNIPHIDSVADPLIAGKKVSSLISKATQENYVTSNQTTSVTTPVVIPAEVSTPTPATAALTASAKNTLPSSPVISTATTTATASAQLTIPTNATWQAFRVHHGDNLARVFKKYKISPKDTATLAALSSAKPLQHLKPGKEMLLIIDDKHKLQKLTYAAGDEEELVLIRTASGFQLEQPQLAVANTEISKTINDSVVDSSAPPVTKQPVKELNNENASLAYASGEVHKSLAADARKAGLSTKAANQLVQIFGRKVQRGDKFNVLYEEGSAANKAHSNNVVLAQLTHAGKLLQMIRFTDPKGNTNYYAPNGESQSAGLLRAPVQYKRISSGFSQSRFHPLLHFFRPHLGVDYAAPTGTPIKAAGNGVIAEIERTGGYGKEIVIKHDSKYSTLYAHMSNFASNLHIGSVVQQGQVIGYVGSTGLATGPHLHYEIHVNNVAMNPLTVSLPEETVPSSYRNQFSAQVRTLMARLKLDQSVRLAEKNDPIKRS